jgi:hypothetical protein
MALTRLALGAAIVSAGVAGHLLGSVERPASPPGSPPSGPAAIVAIDEAALRRTVARVLADELARQPRTAVGAPSAPGACPPAEPGEPREAARAPAGPRTEEARFRAHELVDQARARGAWRAEDGRALRTLLRDLGPVEVNEVMGALAAAVNEQQVRLEDDAAL